MPTALIVEDEPEANKLLAMLVQLRGYQTESALDGAQAMDHLRKHVPDVIFLDLMLPDVDGYDICRSAQIVGQHQRRSPSSSSPHASRPKTGWKASVPGPMTSSPNPICPSEIFEALEHAQAWKQRVESSLVAGEAVLDARDEGQTLRNLARLAKRSPGSQRLRLADDR